MIERLPFQRRFLAGAFAPGIRTAALSLPRGNGKSTLLASVVAECLAPGSDLFQAGAEYVLCAASTEQARHVFRPARAELEASGESYSFIDSQRLLGITHKPTRTRLRVQSSNAKSAMGLVGVPLLIADEPGSWEVAGGQLMFDAVQTAMGKPGSALRAVYIGTLAPTTAGWWVDLVTGGSHGSTHVAALQGDPARWDKWPEIRRVNPLMSRFAESREVLLEERDAARRDTRLKGRFLSYRLNVPTGDETTMLLTLADWKRVLDRPVAERNGRPLVGVDLGGARSWSAAVAVWRSGRVEALAIAPGIPSLDDQEKRDRTARGTYRRLHESGALRVADGRRVPKASALVEAVRDQWGWPEAIFCDFFRIAELRDARPRCPLSIRRTKHHKDASNDIRAVRRMASDGPLTVERDSRGLLTASLAASMVRSSEGEFRLVKRDSHSQARDDVAVALTLAAGAVDRLPPLRPLRSSLA